MAEREIRIPIVGDSSQLKRELDKAERELAGFGGNAKKLAQDFNREFLLLGAGIAAGFGIAIKTAADFDKQMSEVGAVAGATGDDLETLREAALKAGQATVFSASEAAKAQAELAKAGVSTSDILGGALTGALDLASAGSLDLATAAEYAANAMTTFGLSGSDVPRIADALAAGANKSAASVEDMGLALQQSGLVADQTGLTLEETVGVLSLFAQAGLKGSDAGTSLKTALLKLNPASKESAELMAQLGLNFYDANGAFVGISTVAEQLKQKLGPLSEEQRNMALNTIFGTDAIRAATVLMSGGAAEVTKWTNAVSDSGYASDLASQKTDNLAGDLESLKGSIETALIQGGSQATDALRMLAQGLTGVVNGLGEMPAPLQTAFLGATGLIGVGSTAIGVYGTLAPKIDQVKKALEGMGGIGPTVAANLGTIGLAAGGVSIALAAVAWAYGQQAAAEAEAEAMAKRYTDAVLKQTGALEENIDAQTRKEFKDSEVGQILYDTGLDVETMTRAVRENGTALDQWAAFIVDAGGNATVFASKIEGAASAGDGFAQFLISARDAGQITNEQMMDLVLGLDSMNDAFDAGTRGAAVNEKILGDLAGSTGDAATETSRLAQEQLQAAQDAERHTKALEEQYSALNSLAGGDVAYRQSQIDSRRALEEYNAAMKDGTKSADERESAGLDLIDAYLREAEAAVGLASDAREAAGGTLTAAEASDIQKAALERLRDTLAPGNPLRAQLQGYIDKLNEIPPEKQTEIDAQTAEAKRKVQELIDKINEVPRYTQVEINGKVGTTYGPGIGNTVPSTMSRTPSAMGTSFASPNYPRLVGERGPEMFWPSSYGSVISASQTGNMLGAGGGGVSISIGNVTLPNVTNPDEFVDALQKWSKANGPLPIKVAA